MSMPKAMFTSNRDDWETPNDLFSKLNDEFHFDLDAAASPSNAKVSRFFTKRDDALTQDWGGSIVFCNPPYGADVSKWIEKAYRESLKPNTTVVLLVASRTDTKAFHEYILGRAEIRFIRGRLKFSLDGEKHDTAPFPALIAIYGNRANPDIIRSF